MGDRTIEAEGSIIFEDITNNYKAVIVFSTYKKSGFFTTVETGQKDAYTGLIYQSSPSTAEQSYNSIFSKNADNYYDLNSIKDIVKPICEIQGSFLKSLSIDGKKFWDIDEDVPFRQTPIVDQFVCPSDWRFREDLLWLKYNHMKVA